MSMQNKLLHCHFAQPYFKPYTTLQVTPYIAFYIEYYAIY